MQLNFVRYELSMWYHFNCKTLFTHNQISEQVFDGQHKLTLHAMLLLLSHNSKGLNFEVLMSFLFVVCANSLAYMCETYIASMKYGKSDP